MKMERITVLKKTGRNRPQRLHGENCTVTVHREPHAETEDKETVSFPSMKRQAYTETVEWATNGVELFDGSHRFHWGRKRNGKSGDKFAKERVRIAPPEAAAAIDRAMAALNEARQAYYSALDDAWDSAQPITKAKAIRLVEDWPEATQKVHG